MIRLITILLILFVSTAYAGEISDRTEASIKLSLGNDVKIEMQKLFLDKKTIKSVSEKSHQKFLKDFVYYYKVRKDDEIIGYAILDNVYGKLQPITVLAVFDKKGVIVGSYIIKYREQHGKQVTNETWLKQFEGKKVESDFLLGKDIDGISGATISARAVSLGMKRLTILNKHLDINVN